MRNDADARPKNARRQAMKRFVAFMAFMFTASFCANVLAHDVLVGTYANDAGKLVIADAPNGTGANYDVTITDNSGKCNVKITAATNKVIATGKNGAVYNVKILAAVESSEYPDFSLWPEDETIQLAPDALPFSRLDPACQAFRDNMTFTRIK